MNGHHQLYLLHALTPLHLGVDDALGAVDLPTQRERHTGYPLVPGSSVKGVLREAAELDTKTNGGKKDSEKVLAAFGPPQDQAGDYRGGLVLTDAHLLALPVRSLCGTFAWVTCPGVLRRLRRDLELVDLDPPPELASSLGRNTGLVPTREGGSEPASALLIPEEGPHRVFLEERPLAVTADPTTATLAGWIGDRLWPGEAESRSFFRDRLLVVHDDVFGFFTRVGLEVRARVKIDRETGTAADSGPWTEEHIPTEALLWGLAMGRPTLFRRRPKKAEGEKEATAPEARPKSAEDSLKVLRELVADAPLLRFGGHATIGLGRACFRLVDGAEEGRNQKGAES